MAAKLHNYSSIADIQKFWLEDIAPQYFDFEDTNLYKSGNFGYMNEVMSTVTADAFNAINIAKREFYSSTAENISTYYVLAGNFDVDIPMATPAECGAIIFIKEKDILENATIVDGVYNFVLDNTLEIMADTIQFSLDYPIKILGKYTNGAYMYTTYYDTTKMNSLGKTSGKYIQNKTLMIENQRYLLMSVTLKQYATITQSEVITKNSELETVYATFQFDGDIAGFDVFYNSDPGVNNDVYVPAIATNDIQPEGAYCIYEFLTSNKIKITFPKNPYFSPKLNSVTTCKIYVSKGSGGNFDTFNGDLTCKTNSEDYAYNNTIIVRGSVNGKSSKGKDKKTDEEFIREIRKKNCTNGTITTSSDLQIYFNDTIDDEKIRVEFSKNRDDCLKRLYSSFILMKDDNDNVVPTNTCTLKMKVSDFDEYDGTRGVIKPGKIFEYVESEDGTIQLSPSIKISQNLNEYDVEGTKKFLFTNPFLILASTDYQIVGYYGNTVSDLLTVDYTFVEDKSFYQFICLGLEVTRNPIIGEHYYTFTSKISASTTIDYEDIVILPDYEDEDNNIIRAKYNGRVIETFFKDDHVICRVQYDENEENLEYEDIQVSTYSTYDESKNDFVYHIGYTMQFNVLDTFIKGDILAKKKVTDRGKIRAGLDIGGIFLGGMTYIPMYIEDYDEEKDAYTIRGYVSTNDFISLNNTMVLDHGIYNADGSLNDFISIPMGDLTCLISVFYKNDVINYEHSFSNFNFFKEYTMTNRYTTNSATPLNLIKGLDFIRSTFTLLDSTEYIEGQSDEIDEGDGTTTNPVVPTNGLDPRQMIKITQMPLVKSNWIKYASNFKYFINKIYNIYEALREAYFQLENQYGIEILFFNTYGKSKRYKIGNVSDMQPLNSVNCSMSVGIELNAMSTTSIFIEKYRTYLKTAIEDLNDLTNKGKSLFILDLLAESKKSFPEIIHFEYYGFNEYGHMAQIITPVESPNSSTEVQNYVPEFINIYTTNQNGVEVANINIRILNNTALL